MLETLKKTDSKNWSLFLLAALLAGAVLRLAFPGDIEYKADEKYMFDAAQSIVSTGQWPTVGMTTGVGGKNAGMSVWIFGVLALITHPATPPDLARAVQVLNILALVVLAFFSLKIVEEAERTPWLWATVLVAVNPIAILFHRKIWAQCALPLFCVLFWMAWHYRKKWAGAFFWGLIGACLGQVHMSGFFIAGAVFLWTLYRDCQAKWVAWFIGSVLGAIPILPWLSYLHAHPGNGFNGLDWTWLYRPKFWNYWFTDPLGVGLIYTFKSETFRRFLAYPGGTYLVGVLHVLIIVLAIGILVSVKKNGGFSWGLKDRSDTALAIQSAVYVMAILLALACVQVFRHYLVVTFPLEWVWLSRLGLRDPRLGHRYLMALWMAQLCLSVLFLCFLHMNHGDALGNYGVGWQWQEGPPS